MEDLNDSQRRIIASAQNIGKVVYAGSGIAIVVIIVKLIAGQGSLQISGIAITLDKVWILFLVLTAFHAFLAIFLMREILGYLNDVPAVSGLRQVFGQITSGGNLFVHGLISRAEPRRPGSRIYSMDWSDPSTLVAYTAAVIFIAALLPWRLSPRGVHWASNPVLWQMILLTAALAVVNWWAGSIWLIYLSQLDDVATWIEALPDDPISDEDLSRMLVLGEPILNAGTQPGYRCCYEIANILNRLSSNQVPANSKSFLGLRLRQRKLAPSVSEKRLIEVCRIYLYFQTNMPWLMQSSSPWFLSGKRLRILQKSKLNGQKSSASVQRASRRQKWSEEIELLLRGSGGF